MEVLHADIGSGPGCNTLIGGIVRPREINPLFPFGRDSQPRVDHVDLPLLERRDNIIPGKANEHRVKPFSGSDPAGGIDIEPRHIPLLVHVGEGPVIGIDTNCVLRPSARRPGRVFFREAARRKNGNDGENTDENG